MSLALFSILGWLCVGWVFLASSAPQPIQIVRPPAFISDTETVTYQIRIEPDAANRLLVFSAVDQRDGLEARRTEEQLDGDHAPITRWIRWRLNSGPYVIVAALYGLQGARGRASAPVTVRGRYDSPDEEP